MTDTTPTGANLIAGNESTAGDAVVRAIDPRTGAPAGIAYHEATAQEVAAAAEEAFATARNAGHDQLAALLRGAADRLEGLGDALLDLADAETGLGKARMTTERARTCAQLRAFAEVVEDGAYLDAIIDTADPDAVPVPRPDLRRVMVPLGPVAVFGASNFPLAFSVPGGDTAAALAAGCPVVAKAHPSHPGTSELTARAITAALADAGLPLGMFSLLQGASPEVGRALVTAPEIRAVGFTGSLEVGRALYDLAAARPVPIPVYAEMGSVNPVFVTPDALEARAEEIADGFVGSMTMGAGQFCTKPGIVFVPDGAAGDAFVEAVAAGITGYEPAPMLGPGIRDALDARLSETATRPGVEVVARSREPSGGVSHHAAVLTAPYDVYRDTRDLGEEHFGPVAVIVRADAGQMREAAHQLDGQLTATVHAEDGGEVADLLYILREKAGRLIFNGFPTGVAVTAAMHHGGPYPATTAPGHTSVGATAIRRFLRPVVYQNAPQSVLPPALRDHNPLGIRRLVNGDLTTGPVAADSTAAIA